jgi:SAM-dependent methyltransferase
MTQAPRSNSFHFAPEKDVPRNPDEACPLARQPERIPELLRGTVPERSVLLRFKDRMRLFRSKTADFTDDEVARIKALGQIYMDVSVKHAPDDFARDLRKLVLAAECRACPELAGCAGCYSAIAEEVFRRDEAHVLRRVRELSGDILDVGAGHAPYAGELQPAVKYERATYLAIDPDPDRLALLSRRFPWAKTRTGTLEDLAAEDARFDAVMFLRSYNHLEHPARTLGAASSLLRTGGTLLVADDVAFGLVRSREQVVRAESSARLGFEHYRNDSAEEAHAEITRLGGFELIERRDVQPGGSNLWLLGYQKRG